MKPFLLLLLSVFIASTSQAQLKGDVFDAQTKEALPQAAAMLTIKDGTPTFESTDEKGHFEFKGLDAGTYELKIVFMGYKDTTIKNIVIKDKAIILPPIYMASRASELKGVEVSTIAPTITMDGDKMVMNVANTASASGSTAFELLTKAPGVVADQNNVLQLNGKNVTVYIDGRPSRLSGDDLKNYLDGIPSTSIDKLEIMSSPSAKYDAQDGAVINIKTLKNQNLGTNGSFVAAGGAGLFPRGNTGINLNNRSKNMNIYGGYDFLYTKKRDRATSDRIFSNDYIIHDYNPITDEQKNHNVKLGVDYDLNKNSTIGFLVKTSIQDRNRLGKNNTETGFKGQPTDSTLLQTNTGDQDVRNPSANVYYKWSNPKKKKDLTINADYFNYDKKWDDLFNTQYYMGDNIEQPERNTNIRNKSASDINLYSMSADYEQVTKFATWQAGVKNTYTKSDNNMVWENWFNGKWENDISKTNHFIYKENVAAAYFGAKKTIKKWTLDAVLRMEHTYSEGNLLATETQPASKFKRDYAQLFPSLNASYTKDAKHIYTMAYRKSITRFGYQVVNPFIVYHNAYTYSQGNPNIQPMITHNIDLGFTYNYTWITKLGYVYSNSPLSMVYKQNEADKTLVMTYDNLGRYHVAYANIIYTKMLFNKWRTTNVLTGLYLDVTSVDQGGPFYSNSWTAIFNTQNTIALPKKFSLEINGTVQTPIIYGVTKIKGFATMDLGVKKTLSKKANLKLAVNDVFYTRRMNIDLNYQNINNTVRMRQDTRFVMLTFNYLFGNRNIKKAKDRKSSIETESSRTKSTGF
ncbi:hypothetical protein COR50_00405 [Chitinophaga caeni]|uniref:Outer membrane protein beta-barrel domain-containing protein n=1 Tax=Chitinophaga caeni TaxID=2029983 RepID=A0A291QP84_9BACT|nr:outer membrane beta-barrel family protein [Chitinophaga caeni]ATL45741.1 hypothetical protein COR50_00405 [Chitinophaga caeni]